jgi:predicted dehydrogenase
LRYTRYTRQFKQLVDSGLIGDVVSVQHLEPVGYWHQAHSYVRGNWRNEHISSPMLLAKSCHDLDWIRHILGARCRAVSSFGSLKHFRRSEKPTAAGEAQHCLDCAYEPSCPYSAKRIYIETCARGYRGWPLDVVAAEPTVESLTEALQTGPYGRCVYECDNDVVDHQVVNLLFEGQQTATFTMTGFTQFAQRKTRLFGTRGELEGDGETIRHFDFLTEQTHAFAVEGAGSATPAVGSLEVAPLQGHGGGDYALMDSFISAVAENDPSRILSGPDESLETHLVVFAAEQARRENTVVSLDL